jgi:hypothetical protein
VMSVVTGIVSYIKKGKLCITYSQTSLMKMLFAVRNVWLMFFGLGNTLPVRLTWLTIKSVTANCVSVWAL